MKRKEKQFWNLFNLFVVGLLLFTLGACSWLIPMLYNVTATFEEGGSLQPAGEVVVNKGEDQVFTIIPDDGHQIAELLIDGLKVEPVPSYVFNNVTQDHSIHAKFEKIEKPTAAIPFLKKYFITATTGEGGTISPEGKISITKGKTRTFTITPEDGYIISDIEIDGAPVGPLTSYTFGNVQKDHTIHAEFVTCYKLTILPDNADWGTVADQAGEACYAEGTEVSISAAANDGYLFDRWEADAGTFYKENANEATFIMPAQDATVTAVFVKKSYNLDLKANNDEWGTVKDLNDSAPYIKGTKVNILAEAEEGYLFDHWESMPTVTFDDDSASDTTFTILAQDVTVTAIFKEVVTIAGWDFEDGTKRNAVVTSGNISDYTPDLGDGVLSLVGATFGGQQAGEYFTIGSGGKGFAAHSQHWHNGELSKHWQIEVSTLNFKNLKLSSKQRSSGTGPRDFIVEYSIGDSDWHEVPGATIKVANNFTSGILEEIELSEECEGLASLRFRWAMSTTTSVEGNIVGDRGTNRIDDILLTGIRVD